MPPRLLSQMIGFFSLFLLFSLLSDRRVAVVKAESTEVNGNSSLQVERRLLEKKISRDPSNKNDIERLLQLTYSLNDWPSFFGLAQYYRSHFDPSDWSPVYQLELLGLLRHCQNRVLFDLCHEMLERRPQDQNQILAIKNLAELQFKEKAEIKDSPRRVQLWSSAKNLWPVDKPIEALSSPLHLKVFVEGLCR